MCHPRLTLSPRRPTDSESRSWQRTPSQVPKSSSWSQIPEVDSQSPEADGSRSLTSLHAPHPQGERDLLAIERPRPAELQRVALHAIANDGGRTKVADPEAWRLFTSATRRDIVREVAAHGYLNTPTRETGMDGHETISIPPEAASGRAVGMPSPEVIEAESRVAVRRTLAIHRALGVGAAFWEDGKVLLVPPEELPRDVNDVEWTERQIARSERRRSTEKTNSLPPSVQP